MTGVRVQRHGRGREVAPGVRMEQMPPELAVSPLSSAFVDLAAHAGWGLEASDGDLLVYAVSGGGRLGESGLAAGTAVRLEQGEARTAVAGPDGLRVIVLRCGAGCDQHAPLGPPARAAHVDLRGLDAATSGREFQVLFDMHNGSARGTLFLGKVPPGAAPWHFHQYDEIVWILEGHGIYHLAGGEEEFEAGSAFRVRPREVHIVENASTEPMLLLGLFTPAGSPAAAFLATDPRP